MAWPDSQKRIEPSNGTMGKPPMRGLFGLRGGSVLEGSRVLQWHGSASSELQRSRLRVIARFWSHEELVRCRNRRETWHLYMCILNHSCWLYQIRANLCLLRCVLGPEFPCALGILIWSVTVCWIFLEDDTTCTHAFEDHANTLLKEVSSSLETRGNNLSSPLASNDFQN